MKRTNKIFGTALALGALALGGCKAKYEAIDNGVYLASASEVSVTMTMGSTEGTDADIVVRLANHAGTDVTATVKFDESLVAAYNAAKGTKHPVLPTANMTVSGEGVTSAADGFTVTIPAGAISAAARVHIVQMEIAEGAAYLLPVRVTGSTGGIAPASKMGSSLYIVAMAPPAPTPLTTGMSSIITGTANGLPIATHPNNDWNLNLHTFTLEWWSMMFDYNRNNRAMFSNWGVDPSPDGKGFTEFYFRFGDANRPYNYAQLKMMGGQWTGPSGLVPGTWYHWAITWDGVAKELVIYRDGVEYARKKDLPNSNRPDGSFQFQTLTMAGSGSYFDTSAVVAQVRFWNVVRTPQEIKDTMGKQVYKGLKELIAYWPYDKFKDGTTNIIEDITGNGNDFEVRTASTHKGFFGPIDFSILKQ